MTRPRLVQFALVATAVVVVVTSSVAYAASTGHRAPNPAGGDLPRRAVTAPPPLSQQDLFTPIQACRVLATKSSKPLGTGVHSFKVTGDSGFPAQGGHQGGCGIPSYATAVTGTVTSTGAKAGGRLVLFAANAQAPTATTLAFSKGRSASAGTTVKVSPTTGRLGVKTTAKTGLTFDVTGFYSKQIGGTFTDSGTLYSGNGTLVANTHSSTGYFTVKADRSLEGCVPVVSSYYYDYNVSAYVSGDLVYVQMNLYDGTSANYYFQIQVTC